MTIAQPARAPPSGTGVIAVRFARRLPGGPRARDRDRRRRAVRLRPAVHGQGAARRQRRRRRPVGPVARGGPGTARVDLSARSPMGRITLTGPDGDVTLGYDEIGRAPDIDAMLPRRSTAGRHGETMADLLGARPDGAARDDASTPVVRYDEAKLADARRRGRRGHRPGAGRRDARPPTKGESTTTTRWIGRTVDQAALLAAPRSRGSSPLDAPAEIALDDPDTRRRSPRSRPPRRRPRSRPPTGWPGTWSSRSANETWTITRLQAPDADHVHADGRRRRSRRSWTATASSPLLKAVAREVDKEAEERDVQGLRHAGRISTAARDGNEARSRRDPATRSSRR